MGKQSYHISPGLQPECWTVPGLQWDSGGLLDSGGNTRGRVKYSSSAETRASSFVLPDSLSSFFLLKDPCLLSLFCLSFSKKAHVSLHSSGETPAPRNR